MVTKLTQIPFFSGNGLVDCVRVTTIKSDMIAIWKITQKQLKLKNRIRQMNSNNFKKCIFLLSITNYSSIYFGINKLPFELLRQICLTLKL